MQRAPSKRALQPKLVTAGAILFILDDISVVHCILHRVASDVCDGTVAYIGPEGFADMPVWQGVVASMSIPVIFAPCRSDQRLLVVVFTLYAAYRQRSAKDLEILEVSVESQVNADSANIVDSHPRRVMGGQIHCVSFSDAQKPTSTTRFQEAADPSDTCPPNPQRCRDVLKPLH